jgi:two-component system chemotaxis response regulator CheY
MAAPTRRALVVEDDPEVRKLVRKSLERLDFGVTEARTGKEAMDLLAKSELDLVCLDLMLPEQSGYEICEHIRRTVGLRHVPVLVISARALPEDRAHAEEVGADAYLIKPFSFADFTTKVTTLMKARGQPK